MNIPQRVRAKMRSYSPFYQKVWTACAAIPKGEVRTYGWIAQAIGHPKAARAVGMALKSNPFAPTIPCHRVVGSTGNLIGYSGPGGLRGKRALLVREGALKNKMPSCKLIVH